MTDTQSDAVRRYREKGWWRSELLTDDVRRFARASGDRTAVVDGTRRFSYAELWSESQRVAAVLSALGVGPGAVVSSQTGTPKGI